ncbi:S8 family peptidase [Streptomyces sp. NPDC050504]|uniref:S8 family peptidase n=1 Tax=Streptomyces sp. NPDC050504 TaxID=3365618 RepID=UPI0037A630D9
MHQRSRGRGALAAAAALALAAGPAIAWPAYGAPGPEGTVVPTAGRAGQAGPGGAPAHTIGLLTGDAVSVDARGRVVGIVRGEGRGHIPFRVEREGGRTLVVPGDARQLLRSGRVDSRLFDVAELLGAQEQTRRQAQWPGQEQGQARSAKTGGGLPLIVAYGAASAPATAALKSELRTDGDVTVRHAFPSIGAEAVTVPDASVGAVWRALTKAPATGDAGRSAAPGLARVWLDGVRRASLDKSVPQIGAPAAWAKGFDGKGVRVAVLDTGVEENHPELKGRQEAERNFSSAADLQDRNGHGTHVASIVAGTGEGSKGTYKGVAPGARILDGKVLNDNGVGSDSGILAGIEWAAEQGADIVNLSLGAPDTPDTDPLEAVIDRLSAERGILFAVSAGNSGARQGAIASPGSADAALTVGAVDGADAIADFSSRGPRVGGGTPKPDLTAPGVDITAASAAPGSVLAREFGEGPPGYLSISGTSMAAPHAAGAAALLKQRHPTWTRRELKAALIASAEPGRAGAFADGGGRVDVAAALTQTVVAEPTAIGFATQAYPHDDDRPETRKLTYRNLGTAPVTLDLRATGTGPDGGPAPVGMFALSAERVTVPAGGTAAVELTADTRPGGAVFGAHSALVTATGGGHTVRTAAAVVREAELYDLKVDHIGEDGKPAPDYWPGVYRLGGTGANPGTGTNPDTGTNPGTNPDPGTGALAEAGGGNRAAYAPDGSYTVRVPKGLYFVESLIFSADRSAHVAAPHFEVKGDTSITLDARTARPLDITGPDPAAKTEFGSTTVELALPDGDGFMVSTGGPNHADIRFAQLGPDFSSPGTLFQGFDAVETNGGTEYRHAYGGVTKRLATGFVRRAERGDFAEVNVRLGAQLPGKAGGLLAHADLGGGVPLVTFADARPLPAAPKVFLTANTPWRLEEIQRNGADEPVELSHQAQRSVRYRAGGTYRHDLGIGVYGPDAGEGYGIARRGDTIVPCTDLLLDGAGNRSLMWGDSAPDLTTTTLTRNGVAVPPDGGLLNCLTGFKVPAEKGKFELAVKTSRTASATRPTEVSATWGFTSGSTAFEWLPFSVVRFEPKLALDSTAKAGAVARIPVEVKGTAAGGNLKSLRVRVSYDNRTWLPAPVVKGAVYVVNPKAGRALSLRADLVDKRGNTLSQTIRNAYWGK